MSRLHVALLAGCLAVGCAVDQHSGSEVASEPEVSAHAARDERALGSPWDAQAPTDASVAQPSDAAADLSPFACTQAADCVIKDVGNCCGAYPLCVNAGARLPDGECGLINSLVCGFPVVEACDCRANKCVSLQNGKEVFDLSLADQEGWINWPP